MNTDQNIWPRGNAKGAEKETAGEAIGHLVWDSFASRPGLIGLNQPTPVLRLCKGVRGGGSAPGEPKVETLKIEKENP
jgi:hypothetical protein